MKDSGMMKTEEEFFFTQCRHQPTAGEETSGNVRGFEVWTRGLSVCGDTYRWVARFRMDRNVKWLLSVGQGDARNDDAVRWMCCGRPSCTSNTSRTCSAKNCAEISVLRDKSTGFVLQIKSHFCTIMPQKRIQLYIWNGMYCINKE
jgi:hypothetical protein